MTFRQNAPTSQSGIYNGGEGRKHNPMRPIHAESDKLRKLYYSGLRAYERKPLDRVPNPVWLTHQDRCQNAIHNATQLRTLLDYYSHSDEVAILRYHRDGCVSCNALDKVIEFQCREMKRHAPGMHFFDVSANDDAAMVDGMRRFPQLKAFSAGNWQDIDFKPPEDYRNSVLRSVQNEVEEQDKQGNPVTALQAEEMYFSVAAPAMQQVVEDSLWGYYNAARVRIHNYWKQIAIRRTWYFKKYVEPNVDAATSGAMKDASLFGEMKPSQMQDAMEEEEVAREHNELREKFLKKDDVPLQH